MGLKILYNHHFQVSLNKQLLLMYKDRAYVFLYNHPYHEHLPKSLI